MNLKITATKILFRTLLQSDQVEFFKSYFGFSGTWAQKVDQMFSALGTRSVIAIGQHDSLRQWETSYKNRDES